MRSLIMIRIILLQILLLALPAMAGDFLPPDQAFVFAGQQNGEQLELDWSITDGYYLYRERIQAFYETADGRQSVPVNFISNSEIKQDQNFGEVAVFYHQLQATVDLASLPQGGPDNIQLEYQGCAKNGLCYQPQLKKVAINLAGIVASGQEAGGQADIAGKRELGSSEGISAFMAEADMLTTLGIFLLLGIGLSLTPCILPMVPILSGIIVGQGDKLTTSRGIVLSSSYVLGMAVTYAGAGILAATFGARGNLQMYMQNPWVIAVFAMVFVALAMSMFGFYNLALPSRLQNLVYNASNKQQGGRATGVFVMGALSALVVSPCVSAPLAGALVFISSTGDKLMGGLALFALAIGMGLPLIAIGAGGGKLVPKAGGWMNQVKNFFGVLLLGMAVWLLSRILPDSVTLLLWALLLIAYAVYTGALEPVADGRQRLRKAASFTLLFYGCLLLVGAVSGGSDPLHPIQLSQAAAVGESAEKHLDFQRINTADELQAAIDKAGARQKPVMLDFYADWCTACQDMEKHVFSKNTVQDLLDDYVLLQVDVTANTREHKKILDQFGLFGPPSVIFFDREGHEINGRRIQGELTAAAFVEHVENRVEHCLVQHC